MLTIIIWLALYTSGRVEFYFETARTVMDLTLTQTLQNFTSLKYVIPHCGGAYPSIEDRSLSSSPQLKASMQEIYNTRYVKSKDYKHPTFCLTEPNYCLLGYGMIVLVLHFRIKYKGC